MNNIGEKYLLLGTVVLLEGGTKRVMITGFATASSDDPDLIYDYAGCMYPQGFITSNQTVLFDHDQIQKIYHFGLIDPEWVEFQDNLKKFLENLDEQDISAFGANINNTQVGVGPVGVNTNYNAMQANSINTGVGSLGFNGTYPFCSYFILPVTFPLYGGFAFNFSSSLIVNMNVLLSVAG